MPRRDRTLDQLGGSPTRPFNTKKKMADSPRGKPAVPPNYWA